MENLREHPAVKAYCQHGFIPSGENDTQIWGFCPFCKSANKLYVNKETKKWDCKVCDRSGGFVGFLEHSSAVCQESFKGTAAIKLSKSRGLSISTLRYFGIGYNEITDSYTLPFKTSDGKRIQDLCIYKGGRLLSTYSCKTAMLNWQDIDKCNGTIWLCEGGWDGMAMFEILTGTGNVNDVAISVPGAGTFKPLWVPMFRGRRVNVLYDNDEAGQKGAMKVFNFITPVCKELKFLHWSDTDKKGYDLRDLYHSFNNDAETTLNTVKSRLHDLPKGVDIEEVMRGGKKTDEYVGDGSLPEEVYLSYRKWLYVPDTDILDVLFGATIANRMSGDPIWLFIVAPPGMTKSEYVQSISGAPNIESISKLTPKSLVSGYNKDGTDPSLLRKLNGKVLAVKDFTAIFGMNQQARDEIFSTLRDAYDGTFVGIYGHGEKRYEAKFGIIAGVTPAIQSYMESEAALGERFLRYETSLPSSLKEQINYMKRATSNIKQEEQMKKELRDAGTKCLNYSFSDNVKIDEIIQNKIFYLSIWTAMLRATVLRDKFSHEVTFKPFKEIGTRLSKQFIKLLMGICMFRRLNEATDEEYTIIKKLARSTIPHKTNDFVYSLYKRGTSRTFTQAEMAEFVGLPATMCGRLAENMYLLGVMKRVSLPGVKMEWYFTDEFLNIVNESEVYK